MYYWLGTLISIANARVVFPDKTIPTALPRSSKEGNAPNGDIEFRGWSETSEIILYSVQMKLLFVYMRTVLL